MGTASKILRYFEHQSFSEVRQTIVLLNVYRYNKWRVFYGNLNSDTSKYGLRKQSRVLCEHSWSSRHGRRFKLNIPENMNSLLHSIYDNNDINEGTRLVEMIKKSSHSSMSCNHWIPFVLVFFLSQNLHTTTLEMLIFFTPLPLSTSESCSYWIIWVRNSVFFGSIYVNYFLEWYSSQYI